MHFILSEVPPCIYNVLHNMLVKLCMSFNGPLARYVKLRVAHAPGMPGTFSPLARVSDPDMYHDTCVTHVPWCMSGSLISGFQWSRWREKRSRHSRRMRNPQFCISGKWPMMALASKWHMTANIFQHASSNIHFWGKLAFRIKNYCFVHADKHSLFAEL